MSCYTRTRVIGTVRGSGTPRELVPQPQRFVLRFLESRRESPTAMTFRFSTEGTGFRYLSNQAVRLALPHVDDPWGAVRTFSLSSSPSEKGLVAVTCKITDTPFKQALSRLKPGETAEIYGPLGLFLFEPARSSVFIAGGIGITPFRGMLRFAADTGDTRERRVLYSARVPEEFVFRSELDSLSATMPHLRVQYTVTRPADSSAEWTGRVGRVDVSSIREVAAGLQRPMYYVAGLPEMVDAVVSSLQGPLEVPENDIDWETFRGY